MPSTPPPIQVHLRSEDSGGHLSVTEMVIPPGATGPPLHVHPEHDETFYVLAGSLLVQAGEELVTRGAGSLAFAGRGTPHTFANPHDQPARILVLCTPAGFERYFDRVAAEQAGVEPPPSASKPTPPTVMVGPPIAERRRGRAGDA